ncbi:TetR family transcriptional regulator [Modestobacter sp. I12A-02628]|uniref:TetR/AcrR family transcriptional regulator n=1 Tax=Goekera deserti TaxID=2497753 RepID=A0A7K3WGK6_9ACTN|nr:TetR/AcrR family transcriptional regulator [Goekera deserti]MPQ96582.1 TetR family transcriptional regulator [Goekera deserti]NDI47106.1 TetR family transcriptional regulator [Goekera deserti]NEL55496.1 TetR/AcrR family transcriptional regulator [Goekera deserti]
MTATAPRARGEYAKSAARRLQILTAAVEVFSASGFHRGSLRDVAERTGLSQAGVLHHFSSKSELVAAVLTWRDEQAEGRFHDALSGVQWIRALVDLVESNQRESPQLAEMYALLSSEATSPEHPVHEYFTQRYVWVVANAREALERAAQVGHLRPGVDPASAARTLIALMDGLQVQWLYDRGGVDMAADFHRYAQSLFTVDL